MALRVAVIAACPFPFPRGTPVRIQRLAEALARRGHDVHVVTYHLGQGEVGSGVRVHRIPEVSSYAKTGPGPSFRKLTVLDRLLVREIRQLVGEMKIDVIHAHHFEGLMTGAWASRKTGIPVVYDAHTMLESELPYYKVGLPRFLKRAIGKFLDRCIPPIADFTVSVTDTMREKLVSRGIVAADRIAAVGNGVEPEFYLAEQSGAPDVTSGVLVFSGNLAEYQGIDLMLRAFHEVCASNRDVRLLIITDSSFEEYEGLAGTLGVRDRIDLEVASFDQLPGMLMKADIALNPRVDCDGIPQKLLNYMAVGLPVVSFAGSAPVLEHGSTGWVVENGRIDLFAKAILHLLDNRNEAREIGRNAREFIIRERTWDGAAEHLERVFESLIRSSGSVAGIGK